MNGRVVAGKTPSYKQIGIVYLAEVNMTTLYYQELKK